MAQQVLSVEYNGETILSKSFDYEAACLIDDYRQLGLLHRAEAAVSYLFEGTPVTDKVLKSLPKEKRMELAITINKWFQDDMTVALKNV